MSLPQRSSAFKLFVAVSAIACLFFFDIVDFGSLSTQAGSIFVLVIPIFVILITFFIAGWRWSIILNTQGIRPGAVKAFQISCIAAFYNMFLPGGVGGDATRMLYVMPFCAGRRTAGVMSVVVDRALSLLGLVTIGAMIIAVRPGIVPGLESPASGALVAGAVLACGIAGLFVMPRLFARLPLAGGGSGRLRQVLNTLILIARNYSAHSGTLLIAWVMSMVLHGLSLGCIALLGAWSGIGALDWTGYALAGLVSMLANVLPLTPGGIGVGELAFAYVCRLLSGDAVSPFATIVFLFRALTALVSLYGAVVFVFYKADKTALAPSGPHDA